MIEVREVNEVSVVPPVPTVREVSEVSEVSAVPEAPPLTESKANLMARLRASGQWDQASLRKDQIIKELRAGGMKKAEAGELAWRRIAAEFPPLAAATAAEIQAESQAEPPSDPSSSVAGTSSTSSTSTNSASTTPTTSTAATMAMIGDSIPDDWGTIPAKALLEVEFEWVHQNRFLVIQERPSGPVRLDWTRARSPAPSYGAIGLMQFAAANPKGFVDTLVKLRAAQEETQVQGAPNGYGTGVLEDKGLKDIERMLVNFQRQREEEMVKDVPKAICSSINSLLNDWERRHGLTINAEARESLAAYLARLANDAVCALSSGPKKPVEKLAS